MTTQIVAGMLQTNRGYIPLKTTITDGEANAELKTDSTYTVTSQSIGTFADGQQLIAGFANGLSNIFYCYVLRNGTNVCNIRSIASRTCVGQQQMLAVSNPVVLRPGDQLVVSTLA